MVRIHLKKEAVQGLNGNAVVLQPGFNSIPLEAWEKVADLDLTKWFIGEGIISIVRDEQDQAPEVVAASSLDFQEVPVADVPPPVQAEQPQAQAEPTKQQETAPVIRKGRKGRR